MNYQRYSPGGFSMLPPVIKNLLIINGLFFLATMAFSSFDLSDYLGLHYPKSELFNPIQFVTYMFMHGGIGHIFFNMFALWMFGNTLENVWGPKRFLIYYMITGIGAGIIHLIVTHLRISAIEAQLTLEQIEIVYSQGLGVLDKGMNYIDPDMGTLNALLNGTTVGASGSVFGILLAFGMMFPNTMLYLYFAIPVKAKYFVIGYGLIELFSGVMNQEGDNVAHFAHLGGMLFGFALIKYWQKRRTNF